MSSNTTINKKVIGMRLKVIRGKRSLRFVEQQVGIDDAIIQRIETGRYGFKTWADHVYKLCKFYDVLINEVLYENQ